MSFRKSVSETTNARRTQRQPRSCESCARAKIRCNKAIPCLSCIDRGQAAKCRREIVQVTAKRKKVQANDAEFEGIDLALHSPAIGPDMQTPPSSTPTTRRSYEAMTTQQEFPTSATSVPNTAPHSCVPHIQSDAIITLEFLSHGRQSILRFGDNGTRTQPEWATSPASMASGNICTDWDSIFTPVQANSLLAYHQETIAWMHNVVHMPTFRSEFNERLSSTKYGKSWEALYCALLCTTLYHGDEDHLSNLGILSSISLVQMLYNRSIQCLHDANFMAAHSITSIQTVCVLLQVAYNLDQSDFIQVLLSTAIRIAQSLGLHRLGPDRGAEPLLPEGMSITQFLIEREVKKRTWWFLVRQDWLQIPFQNTYVISANQFNTPMPLNCYEEESEMVRDGKILVQPDTVFTQSSYTNEIHKVAIVIWKHQERMCAAGHPGDTREGVLRLYDQTLWADAELKQRYKEMPLFFRDRDNCSTGLPDYVKQLSSIHLLSTAHKIHTIHRYFQLQSFRDKAFAFTQNSCIAISQRCIKDVETWPADAAARMALKTWTVITHIITCCISLTFASIFRDENILLYDGPEMHRLSRAGREAIGPVEEWSSIARRGGALLDALFELEDSMSGSDDAHFRIEDIIRKVLEVGNTFQGRFPLAPDLTDSYFDFDIDWSLG